MTIDQAYQFVMYVCNKEQRGNITPDQFNMLAPIMQLSVINDRIGNIKKYKPHDPIPPFGGEMNRKIREELRKITLIDTSPTKIGPEAFNYPSNCLYVFSVTDRITNVLCREVTRDEEFILINSVIKPPSVTYPLWNMRETYIGVRPSTVSPAIEYIKKPTDPKWNYTGNPPVYNPTGSVDFAISDLCHLEICMKILAAVGVNLDADKVLAYAAMEENTGS